MSYAQEEMREKQLNIRLSAEEQARLDRVAKHYGLNAAGVIRMLVKREDDALAAAAVEAVAERARKLIHDLDALEGDIQRTLKWHFKGKPVRDIAEALEMAGFGFGRDRAAVQKAIKRLEKLGILKRTKQGFSLTPAGQLL